MRASRSARLFAAASVAASVSCRSSVTETLDLDQEDVAVITVLHKSGEISAWPLNGAGVALIPFEESDQAYAWIYGMGSFVDLMGFPLDVNFRTDLAVRLEGQPRTSKNGSCGRCILPSDTAPEHVAPGDSCLLPRFARVVDLVATERRVRAVEVPIAGLEMLRKRVYLEWPGTCP